MQDFLSIENCERCGESLKGKARTMSWFTTQTICMKCSAKEDEIKAKLRAKGIKDAMEGCGYIPKAF